MCAYVCFRLSLSLTHTHTHTHTQTHTHTHTPCVYVCVCVCVCVCVHVYLHGGVAVVSGHHDRVAVEALERAVVDDHALSALQEHGREPVEGPVACAWHGVALHERGCSRRVPEACGDAVVCVFIGVLQHLRYFYGRPHFKDRGWQAWYVLQRQASRSEWHS